MQLRPKFLYVAHNAIDPRTKKYRFFKIGKSHNPEKRMSSLNSSGSVDVFRCLFQIPLPAGVTDTHVLQHRLMRPFVLRRSKNVRLQATFTRVWGERALAGLQSRRELVMFGRSKSMNDIQSLLQSIVRSLKRPPFVAIPLTSGDIGIGKVMHMDPKGRLRVQWYGGPSAGTTLKSGSMFTPGWTTPSYLKPYYANRPTSDHHVPYYVHRDEIQLDSETHHDVLVYFRLNVDGRIPELTRKRLCRHMSTLSLCDEQVTRTSRA